MFKKLLLLLMLSHVCALQAQVQGTVKDSKGEPLPFVNVYLEGGYDGTTTNGEGVYELDVLKKGASSYTIIFQFLGYRTVKEVITTTAASLNLDIVMQEETTSLDEVVVEAGVNPADRIIRATIANRKENLERLSEYQAKFYSRGLWKVIDAPEKILGQDVGDLGGGLDSTRTGIIYLSETISEIAYQRPNNFSEKIIASKVSGDDNGFSFNTAIDANFSFYENTIDLNAQIVSPIATNAFSYYRYTLIGTFYENGKLINKIQVTPRRPKDRVFSGLMYIVEDDWQLYGVELDTSGEAIQVPIVKALKFKQNYTYDKQYDQWVKLSQVIDFSFGFFGFNGEGRFTAGYSDYNFEPNFTKKSFSNEILSFAPEANKKDSMYWESKRPVPLTELEADDYVRKDSIQVVRKSRKYLDSIDANGNKFSLLSPVTGYTYSDTYNRWNAGFDGPLGDISFNTVQGWNGSVGLNFFSWSDDDYTKTFSAFANANYGFSDERLRWTTGFSRRFNRTNRARLSVRGGQEIRQYNNSNPISDNINTITSLFFEKNYAKFYEVTFGQVNYSQEVFNGLRLFANAAYEERISVFNTTDQAWYPKDDEAYTSNNPLDPASDIFSPIFNHDIFKATLTARVNFGQKYYNYPTGKFNINSDKYPTLFLTYDKGFGASDAELNFDQLELRLLQGMNLGNKGRFRYNIKAGTFLGDASGLSFVDYKHFNGNQTRVNSGYTLNSFQLLPYYARSTNSDYLELHAEHNFRGWILGKIPGLNQLNFNLVAGAHVIATPDAKPYTELSIGLDNIGWGSYRLLRVDYVRSTGLGKNDGAIVFGLKFLGLLD
jgi:hypothetical protein